MKTRFIVFDGIDGSGKSTQVQLLASYFESIGVDVILTREPTNGKWGSLVRKSATSGRLPFDLELEYLLNDRDEHLQNVIIPSLKANKVVISDRYYYSTIAYQGARSNDVESVKQAVLKKNFLKPDVTFIFDVPVDIAIKRITQSRHDKLDEFEQEKSLREVQKNYNVICKSDPGIIRINGSENIDSIHTKLLKSLQLQKNL